MHIVRAANRQKASEVMIMVRDEILAMAVHKYGIKNQFVKALEELCELGQAIAKFYGEDFTKGDKTNIAEEIADVRIMIDQIVMALQLEEDVHRWDVYKLIRLKKRMEGGEGIDG